MMSDRMTLPEGSGGFVTKKVGDRFIVRNKALPGFAAYGATAEEAESHIDQNLDAYERGARRLHEMQLEMIHQARSTSRKRR